MIIENQNLLSRCYVYVKHSNPLIFHSLAIYNHVNVSFYFYQGKQIYFKGKCTILIKSTLL